MIYRLIIFLIINFGALAIGGFFTGKGGIFRIYSQVILKESINKLKLYFKR